MTAKHPGLTHIMCFDVETTGQNVHTSEILELAATVWKIGDKSPLSQLYYWFGTPKKWCPKTREEFWDNPDKGENGLTPYEALKSRLYTTDIEPTSEALAAVKLTAWAREWYKKTDGGIIVLTDTSGFDYQFITDLLSLVDHMPTALDSDGLSPPLSLSYLFGKYQPVRDINSWYLGMGGTMQKWGSRDRMLARLGVEFPEWVAAYEHNPQNDANSIAAMASFILSLEEKPAQSNKRQREEE